MDFYEIIIFLKAIFYIKYNFLDVLEINRNSNFDLRRVRQILVVDQEKTLKELNMYLNFK